MTWTKQRFARAADVINLDEERKRRARIDENRATARLYSTRARTIHASPRSVQHSFVHTPDDAA